MKSSNLLPQNPLHAFQFPDFFFSFVLHDWYVCLRLMSMSFKMGPGSLPYQHVGMAVTPLMEILPISLRVEY